MRMPARGKRIVRSAATPGCPSCGSTLTSPTEWPDRYYCHRCRRTFDDVASIPFDFIADEWMAELAVLQHAGDAILVRLSAGFYGVCLIRDESLIASTLREQRRSKTRPPLRAGFGIPSP